MGSGNAVRVTEPETFTLIQLEEERQKLKKKELLKNMLTDSEFSIKGQCAINLMMTKIDIINTFLLMHYGRNFIQMKIGRLKSYDSVCKKMQKKGLDLTFSNALDKINDLIGVRAVCAYIDDIYKVADLLQKQQDIRVIKIKDYIRQPKKSGYQSLHFRKKTSGSSWSYSFGQLPWITGLILIIIFAIKEIRNRQLLSTRNCSNVPP